MKYPRTYHLPFSPGAGKGDDKVLESVESFLNTELIITEKMDGSNTCMESDACFARSHSGPPDHPSFDAFKAVHATVKHNIKSSLNKLGDGDRYQIFGEWLYAKHSIWYDRLPNYFMMFGIRILSDSVPKDNRPWWMPWTNVKNLAIHLGLPTVPELARVTVQTEADLKAVVEGFANAPSLYGQEREGVVIRKIGGYTEEEFSTSIAKWVRSNHVQTDEHWKHQEIVRNLLA